MKSGTILWSSLVADLKLKLKLKFRICTKGIFFFDFLTISRQVVMVLKFMKK